MADNLHVLLPTSDLLIQTPIEIKNNRGSGGSEGRGDMPPQNQKRKRYGVCRKNNVNIFPQACGGHSTWER